MDIRFRKVEHEEKLMEDNKIGRQNNWILPFILHHKINISIIIRLFSLITCCTYYVPDEYWQSTEVAHRSVYAYGHLTWEWHEKIRSYLHPFIFELYFRFTKLTGVDCAKVLIYGPHVIQAFLSVAADNAVYRHAWNIFRNKDAAILALMLHWSSWFVFYTSSRTLSNTAEMCFLIIGLSYFPFNGIDKELNRDARKSLFFAILFGGIGCIIRSTSLIIWCPFVLGCLVLKDISLRNLIISIFKSLPFLTILSFGIDYYFYKDLVFVHFNFLKFNIFQNFSAFYGSHPFHWYLTQGIPVVFSFHIILIVAGVYYSRRTMLFWVAIIYVIIHSFIPHKEFRFLLPVCPIFMCYAGYGMEQVNKLSKQWSKRIFVLIMVTNTALAAYFSIVHQRGTISVMSYLRNKDLKKYNHSILFLMPCHSTPYYSHLHQEIQLKFLTCLPNQSDGYVDESDQFYKHPAHWLDLNVGSKSQKPSHIVMFSVLSKEIHEKLVARAYIKDVSFFHTHFPEGRVGSYVDVYLDKDIKIA